MSLSESDLQAAQQKLDAHLREIVAWHFSPETGCPFWLGWAKANYDPRKEVNSFADLIAKFPHFQDETLHDLQPTGRSRRRSLSWVVGLGNGIRLFYETR